MKQFNLVSIHAPTRGATLRLRFPYRYGLFQSTLPRGERPDGDMLKKRQMKFQSTLPRGERLEGIGVAVVPEGFNPRSHAGSDIIDLELVTVTRVSIHAPTRGAT